MAGTIQNPLPSSFGTHVQKMSNSVVSGMEKIGFFNDTANKLINSGPQGAKAASTSFGLAASTARTSLHECDILLGELTKELYEGMGQLQNMTNAGFEQADKLNSAAMMGGLDQKGLEKEANDLAKSQKEYNELYKKTCEMEDTIKALENFHQEATFQFNNMKVSAEEKEIQTKNPIFSKKNELHYAKNVQGGNSQSANDPIGKLMSLPGTPSPGGISIMA